MDNNNQDVVDIKKLESNTKSLPTAYTNKSVGVITDHAQDEISKKFVRGEMSASEGARELAHVITAAKSLDESDDENKDFLKEIKTKKQKEISESFESERLKAEADKLESKRIRAEAFYNNFRPILEFDFSALIPKGGRKKLFKKNSKEESSGVLESETTPKYSDRSYGIPLMILMLALLTAPYCICTIVLSIFNGLNAIFEGVARFGKPAMIICGSLMIVIICSVFVYCLLLGVDHIFGTSIIS